MGRWFDLYATRIGEPYERMVGVLFKDITDHKRAEEALREADRRKDEFLAILAHELRNPLAPIRNGVEILRLTEKPGQRGVPSILPMMERQIRHMGRLLDELLDISRITLGKIELRRQPMDVAQAIDAAVETTRPFIEERHHTLEVVLPSEPVRVDADPVRLSQVFANLLNNAAKYMDAGGRISVRAERQGEFVVISVRDFGVGIAPPACRPSSRCSRAVAVLRATCKADSGLAWHWPSGWPRCTVAASKSTATGWGTEANSGCACRRSTIRRPRSLLLLQSTTAKDADSGGGRQPRRRDRALLLLQMMGNEVRTAHGGEEAIRLAAEFLPQAVLLDLGMPKMDGYEVCRHLRDLPSGAEMAVIAITGWGQDKRPPQDARETGFDVHLVKPVDSNELMRVLSALPVTGQPH